MLLLCITADCLETDSLEHIIQPPIFCFFRTFVIFLIFGNVLQDFLGLVEKFFYLSGRYNVQLTVGDAVMVGLILLSKVLIFVWVIQHEHDTICFACLFQENSFLKAVGHIDLDLPEAPEKAPQPPAQPLDPNLIYGPKAEIAHIFRVPEKLPPKELSLTFLGLTLLPFLGFLLGVSIILYICQKF
jgi:oligosaccharyltransferase complex subunit delta (ribophorin II)